MAGVTRESSTLVAETCQGRLRNLYALVQKGLHGRSGALNLLLAFNGVCKLYSKKGVRYEGPREENEKRGVRIG